MGQALIRAAELRTVLSDLNSYKTAVMTFRDKYAALPGDMTDATAFWGSSSVTCDCSADIGGTCNGNGDGYVGSYPLDSSRYEKWRFWSHLNYSGLIKGGYTGGCISIPNGNISGSVWTALTMSIAGNADNVKKYNNGSQSQHLTLLYSSLTETAGTLFTPAEAMAIDQKIDDGKAGSGTAIGYSRSVSGLTGCGDSNYAGAGYNLTLNTNVCSMYFFIN